MDRKEMRRRMAQHARAVSFAEAERVLGAYGWTVTRIAGSHHRFSRGGSHLTIPLRRPHILPVYVRQILAMTAADDEADEQKGETDDTPDA
jgi:predicted RNA binding protein YcfA (HicA-like mRNA interferase family)